MFSRAAVQERMCSTGMTCARHRGRRRRLSAAQVRVGARCAGEKPRGFRHAPGRRVGKNPDVLMWGTMTAAGAALGASNPTAAVTPHGTYLCTPAFLRCCPGSVPEADGQGLRDAAARVCLQAFLDGTLGRCACRQSGCDGPAAAYPSCQVRPSRVSRSSAILGPHVPAG